MSTNPPPSSKKTTKDLFSMALKHQQKVTLKIMKTIKIKFFKSHKNHDKNRIN